MITSKKIKRCLLTAFFCSVLFLKAQISVNYLIVGGGGGGGGGNDRTGGGGSGGEVKTGTTTINSGTNYTVTVGGGGRAGSGTGTPSQSGASSSFNNISSVGGGFGGWRVDNGSQTSASSQAYGGGSHHYGSTSSVNGSIANRGGAGYDGGSNWAAGGGGGAGGNGGNGSSTSGGSGGAGLTVYISGSAATYGAGGSGGRGNSSTTGSSGGANTGRGGNGGSSSSGASSLTGGAGGSGIVIIRYAASTPMATGGTITSFTGDGTNGTTNGVVYQVHTFTSGGTFTYTAVISSHPSTTTQNICIGGTSTALSVTVNGTSPTYQWYSNASNSNSGGTLISGATSQTYTPPTNVAGTQYYYCYTTSSSGNQTSNVSGAINILNPTASTSITGTTSICEGSSTTLTSVGGSDNYQWQTGSCGGTNTGTNASTLTVSPLVTTTYYLLRYNGSCSTSCVSVTVTVTDTTVDTNLPTTYTGSISGGNSITSGSTATLTISGHSGTVAWQSSTNNSTFTNVGSSATSYTTAALSTTTYYRARVLASTCKYNYTNTNAVIVNPAPAGTTSPSITIAGTTLSVTNNTATAVDPNLTMSFTGNLTGFTVTISENYTNGDVLSYTGALPSGVTASAFSTQRRSITFTGSASAANWQAFLRTITIRTTSATCNPETRKVTFSASTNFYNFFNGHYYEYVSAKKNWTQARDFAASKSFYGRQGYLVVINSAEENAYISQMIGYNTWLGGTDNFKLINAAVGYTKYANQAAAEGKYHWVTGPEKGVNFSNGNHSPSIPAGRYCRWQSGEPNNYNTGFYDNHVGAYGEHYMHIYADRKTWNDFPNDRYFASIIEYGDMPGDSPQGTIEGTRNISVNVPATGSISGAATVCSGTNSTTLTLSGNAGGSTVARWEKSEDNFLETTNTLSSTSTSYTVTNLTKTTYFRAVVVNGACTTVTKSVAITVVDLNAGDITATTNQVCTGQSTKLTLSGLVGTVQKWQTATNTGGPYTDIANTTTSLTRTVSSAGTHYFRSVVNTSACVTSDIYSDWYAVVATTGATPTGGEVSSRAHCSTDNSGTLELTGATGGTFTWQTSTNGSTWTSTSVTASTYNYANVTQNTYYRVVVSNGCNTANSSTGSVIIYGTNKCLWTGGTSTDWGTTTNWCNGVIATNGADFDISPDATYNLVLDRNRTVGTINFNGAEKYIYLGNHRLIVTSIEGADTVNHIKTNGNGELRTSIANNDSFTFCVGAGTYNPVKITNRTGSTDDFTVRLIDNVYDRGNSGNALNTPRIKRTWFIDKIGGPANSGSGIDMAFDWYNNDVAGTITTYRLYHYNGNNWDKLSAGTYATRTRNLKYSGYTGTFSPFSMGDDVVLLPVNWQGLSCTQEDNNRNRINWATGSETLSDSFVLERATQTGQFQRIGAIPAAGNSYTVRRYSMVDEKAPAGALFYRVKQTDKEGNGSYSEICQVNADANKKEKMLIFPNPADNNVYVLFSEGIEEGAEISMTDITGKLVLRKKVQGVQTSFSISHLPTGMYLVQLQTPSGIKQSQKTIIQH